MSMKKTLFPWGDEKDKKNRPRHHVSFSLAHHAFLDPYRILVENINFSGEVERFCCISRAGAGIMAVRFTDRGDAICIYGAGYRRKGRKR